MKIETKFSNLVFISLVASSVIFSGCGGGGGSSSSSNVANGGTTTSGGESGGTCPNSVALTLENVNWAAYRTGSNAWQVISADKYANGSVTIPVGEDCKFSTAYVCENDKMVNVSHLSSSDIAEGTYSCTTGNEQTYTVTGQVTGIGDGNGAWVSMGGSGAWSLKQARSRVLPDYSLSYIEAGTHDLAAVETNSVQIAQRFAISRDIEITGDATGKNVDLSSGYGMDPYSIDVTGADYASAALVTANDTHVNGIHKFDTNTWYKPTGGTISGDRISFSSGFTDDTNKNGVNLTDNKTLAEAGNYSYDLTAIPLLNASANDALPVQINGLNYDNADLLYYQIILNNEDNSGMTWNTIVTKNWLGTATSHLQDDFSTLDGWKSAWYSFETGKSLKWRASAHIVKTKTNTRSMRGFGLGLSALEKIIFWIYVFIYGTFIPQ